ncbi:hypothetical protein CHUAL_004323 [Chamberlinius hualienensis]
MKLSFQQKVEVLLILVTILHIGFLIKSIINCDTIETVSDNRQTVADFPDFTICSNVPVRRNATSTSVLDIKKTTFFQKMNDLYREFENALNKNGDEKHIYRYGIYYPWFLHESLDIEPLTKKNELDIMNHLANLTAEERMNYAEFPLMEEFIASFHNYLQRQARVEKFSMNNLYYGNCIQLSNFQTDTDEYYEDHDVKTTFQLKFHIPHFRNGEFTQDDMAEKYYVMIIHEPHTEPIFENKNIIKLWPHTQTRINVEKVHYTYDKDCVWNRNQTGSNYIYSVEGCMASCLQQLTIKYCNCQLPQFSSDHQYPSCTGCSKIPQHQLDNCNCLPPCSYFKYNVKKEIVYTVVNEMDELKTYKSKTQSALNLNDDQASIQMKTHEYYYANSYLFESFLKRIMNCKVLIKISNPMVDEINVISLCRFEIVLSQVGGILGTYTGLCVMMIVEMTYNYIKKCVQIKRQPKLTASHKDSLATATSSISLVARIEDSVPVMKLFWSALLFIGLYNTFVQGYQLIGEYTQFSVKTTSEIINQIQFPSVTICSNNMLQPNASQDTIDIVLREKAKQVSFTYNKIQKNTIWETTLQKLSSFSYNERYENGLPLKSYSIFFNPNEVRMQLQYKPPLVADLVQEIGLVVYIHPKSTSVNSVDFTKEIIIKPGFNYSLKFSTMIKEHLPAPYPSNCVWPTSPEQQWKNNFHDHSNEFEYTQNECQSAGIFNDTFADSFVTLPNQFQGRISMTEMLANFDKSSVKRACPVSCRDVIHQIEEFKVNTKTNGAEPDEKYLICTTLISNIKYKFHFSLEDNWTIRHQHPITDYNEIVAPYAPSWLTIGPYKVETALTAEEPVVNVLVY